ncbi:LysR family transcriptional regulator [Bacillus spongiae]|uniref:LysR family transcriptional regulator n=1 Tax=Bacillus spongiae TaxID=2683610 RepID=A0ABU8HEY0_9BACI
MTLLQYEIFHAVIDLGSFTKAGDKLGLTQSAISHAIRGLEDEFNLTLIKRGRNGVALTSEGKVIIEFTRQILNLQEKMKQEAGRLNGLEVGTVRIGTFPSVSAYLLPILIEKFHSAYPHIHLEFYEGGYQELRKMLVENIIDVSFLNRDESEKLDFIPLFEDHLYVIFSKSHPLANEEVVSVKEIANDPFIMPKAGCDFLVKKLLRNNHISPNIFCEISDNQTIIEMVQKNLGVSIVPKMVVQKSNHDELSTVPLHEECYRTIGLALPSVNDMSPAVSAFINVTNSLIDKDNIRV